MKPYSLGNNDLITNAKHDVEEHLVFYKLNNTVFGKTMENVKHLIDLRLTTNPKLTIKQFSNFQC